MQSEGGFGRAQHTITFAPLPQRERSNEEIEPRIVRMIADNANAFFIRVLREIRGSLSRIFRTRRYDCDTAMDIPYDEILAVVRKPGDPTDRTRLRHCGNWARTDPSPMRGMPLKRQTSRWMFGKQRLGFTRMFSSVGRRASTSGLTRLTKEGALA